LVILTLAQGLCPMDLRGGNRMCYAAGPSGIAGIRPPSARGGLFAHVTFTAAQEIAAVTITVGGLRNTSRRDPPWHVACNARPAPGPHGPDRPSEWPAIGIDRLRPLGTERPLDIGDFR
jgi:hypothetical protein